MRLPLAFHPEGGRTEGIIGDCMPGGSGAPDAAGGLFVICVAETGQGAVGSEPALSGRVRPTTERAVPHFTKFPACRMLEPTRQRPACRMLGPMRRAGRADAKIVDG